MAVRDLRSVNSSVDANDRHGVLPGPPVGTLPILVRYRVNFSTAAIMAPSLAGVRTVQGRPAFTCAVDVTFRLTETLLQS
jgi:hypothetical protein